MRFTVTRVLSDPALAQNPSPSPSPPLVPVQGTAPTQGASAAPAPSAAADANAGATAAPGPADWDLPVVRSSALGSGGQADVYKIETAQGGVYAAKLFKSDDVFLNEYAFSKKLARQEHSHPNLLQIHGGKLLKGNPALITEYVQGAEFFDFMQALHTHMKQVPKEALLATNAIVTLGVELFSGLAHLERLGLTHGDIKPDNLMVTQNGDLKIIDFGFGSEAKIRPTLQGTVGFMGPEITRGGPSTLDRSKVDTFAAANTLLGLLSGYQIGQDFERLVPIDFCYTSFLRDCAIKHAHIDRRLTAERFSQSLAPEVVLGAIGTFFGPNTPAADPVAGATDLAGANDAAGPRAADLAGAAAPAKLPPQARPAMPFAPNPRDPLAAQLNNLLSQCIRSDWHQRPSAAQMCEDLEMLQAMHMRPSDAQEVRDLLKHLVKATPAHQLKTERTLRKEDTALEERMRTNAPPLPRTRPYLRATPRAAP